MNNKLHYREDGTFTIVQFTDLHWQNGEPDDVLTRLLMERVLEQASPDLVIFTGDVIYSNDCIDPKLSFRDAVRTVDMRGIPWAAVFGNHDTERLITREELMDVQLEHKNCVAEAGPKELSGAGNCVLLVREHGGDKPLHALYLFDSGSYSELPHIEGYAWIGRDQIDWYSVQAKALKAANGGEPLPSLAFFHIPLPEYEEVWRKELCYGSKHEGVASPPINSGLFAAMQEMGDVAGTFCGHDHVNDYWGGLHGIKLCYGRASGYQTYGREGFPRGARVIRLRKGERDFTTELLLDDGTVIHEPEEHYPKGME
ncbi:metallophosphoesterase family protein [Paenibacillus montanisoli]|uniref:Metallophosphoesterase n=1 Tax=Paenibacillus montanisoli TaxID=2081970 RepID=A0A328TX16_9BACL|nr:metallophosphoesterase family protein [Paenibacillus montanisoli]RAP74960.1 metallophosphoesterase [Paenibacillus montanisoli]